ncbi:hypothetical protein JZ751_029757 [Albula glossodonta]|uniref:Transmembrane protein n=1 Tax=Albula glossodonta TaxID=121402 RepID=A0A8T2MMV9_9TELE|nr:hypothetical protein JZ751_029757 [Albula glossodonta]
MAIAVLKKVSVLILLQIFEHLMEPLFSSCPCNSYQGPFICLYFIVPAFSFTVLAISLKWGKNFLRDCKSRGCSWYKLFQFRVLIYPVVFWVVILLIDGRYLACGLYTKCNGTMTTVDMKDPEMVEKMAISKIFGYSLLLVTVLLLYGTYLLCENCCRSPEDRYEDMYRRKLEAQKEEYTKKYAKEFIDKRAQECDSRLQQELDRLLSAREELTSTGEGQSAPAGEEQSAPAGEGQSVPANTGQDGSTKVQTVEMQNLLPKGEPQPAAAATAAKPERGELDAKSVMKIINEVFSFQIKKD